MKKLKKSVYIPVIVMLLVLILLSVLIFLKARLPAGELKITDGNGNILARYSKADGGFIYENELYCDYVENALCEAADVLPQKYRENISKLYTTDTVITTYFDKNSFNALKNSFGGFNFDDGKNAEGVICSADGKITASIGKSANKNAVTALHKAGSALKPISVYAPALKEGIISWASYIKDSPVKKISENGKLRDWPANYEGVYSEKNISLSEAIKKSLNTVSVRVLEQLTAEKSCEFAEQLGIDVAYEKSSAFKGSESEIYGNLGLGELKTGVTAEQLAAAYQIFANGGKYTEKRTVSKIVAGEKSLYTANPEAKEILSAEQAYIMNRLLQGVVTEGGTAADAETEGIPLAGKTGTSEGYRDNWFVGLTPDYICAVWYGYDENIENRGKNEAIDIFKNTVSSLNTKTTDFPKCENVIEKEYCIYTGMIAKNGCNQTETGFFDKNNLPTECNRH